MAYGYITIKPRFELGRTVATKGTTPLCEYLVPFLHRHHCGDWGDLNLEDKAANENALTSGLRIFSRYLLEDGNGTTHPIYIITESDRSLTTIMLATEY